jgi:hypothetical protein
MGRYVGLVLVLVLEATRILDITTILSARGSTIPQLQYRR